MCLLTSREERRAHLKLDEACKERGGNSTMFRGLLADYLGTEIFVDKKIVLCHACHNQNCSNPVHMYWGTYADNIEDQKENGTWKNVWERRVEKHGLEKAKAMNRREGNRNGSGNRGKPKSEEHKRKIAEAIRRKNAGVA